MDTDIIARDNLLLDKEREIISVQQLASKYETEITSLNIKVEKSRTEIQEKDRLVSEWKATFERLKEQVRADKDASNNEWKTENEVAYFHI